MGSNDILFSFNATRNAKNSLNRSFGKSLPVDQSQGGAYDYRGGGILVELLYGLSDKVVRSNASPADMNIPCQPYCSPSVGVVLERGGSGVPGFSPSILDEPGYTFVRF